MCRNTQISWDVHVHPRPVTDEDLSSYKPTKNKKKGPLGKQNPKCGYFRLNKWQPASLGNYNSPFMCFRVLPLRMNTKKSQVARQAYVTRQWEQRRTNKRPRASLNASPWGVIKKETDHTGRRRLGSFTHILLAAGLLRFKYYIACQDLMRHETNLISDKNFT